MTEHINTSETLEKDEVIASYGEIEELEQKFQHSKTMLNWVRKLNQPNEIRALAIIVYRYDRKVLSFELDSNHYNSDSINIFDFFAEKFGGTIFGSVIGYMGNIDRMEKILKMAELDEKEDLGNGFKKLLIDLQQVGHSKSQGIEIARNFLISYAAQEGFRYVGKNKRLQDAVGRIQDRELSSMIVGDDGEFLQEEEEA